LSPPPPLSFASINTS